MSFVDKVKNPLDNDEFLKSMILLYARQSNEDRKSGSYIYDELIKHPESEADADKNIHTWNFKKFVEQDTVCKLLTDVLRYSQEEAIRIYMNLFLEGKDESEIDSINIDKGELVSKLEDADILDIHYDDKYMEMPIKDILREAFTAKGTMGYHVYKSKFGDKWATSDATMKFYINAGENIAGNSNIDAAIDSFLNSDAHKQNILSNAYNYIGIGIEPSNVYGYIIVLMFIGR